MSSLNLKLIIPCVALLCVFLPPTIALLLGVIIAWFCGNPFFQRTHTISKYLLAVAIVGLGASMDLHAVLKTGLNATIITGITILAIFMCGLLLGKLLSLHKETCILITAGTAICGGSAIAAIAPILNTKNSNITIALGTIFLLNAFALIILPPIGHFLELSQEEFGLWAALSIHDTSSVIGAASAFGDKAIDSATTTKLTRALWIIPLTIGLSLYMQLTQKNINEASYRKLGTVLKNMWFILGFVLMAALVTWVPSLQNTGLIIYGLSKQILVVALFFIGLSFTKTAIKSLNIRPLIHGFMLWLVTLIATLFLIKCEII